MASPEQRRALQHALEFTPVGENKDSIHLISQGVSELTEEFNPDIEETHYIADKNGTTNIKRYAMTVPLTMEYIDDDKVCKFIRDRAMKMSTGSDAEVKYIRFSILDKETTPEGKTGNYYTAYKYNASVSVSSMGGAGEDFLGIEAQLNLHGDPIEGKIIVTEGDTKTYTFTPDSTSSTTSGTGT